MRSNHKTLLLFFVIIFAISLVNQSNAQKWKGNKKVKNGITYIYNPEKPIHYRKKLPFPKLTEIMSIGAEGGDEKYVLGAIFGISFDSKENIYLLDNPNHCIKVYDKNGKYLKRIGRHGKGPGEFNNPAAIRITSDNKIIVFDMGNQRICILNSNGDFDCSFIIPIATTFLLLNKNDDIILVRPVSNYLLRMNRGKFYPFLHFDLNGKKLLSYGETHYNKKGGYSSASLTFAKILPNGNLLAVFANFYRILEYDPSGKLIREINKRDRMVSKTAIIKKRGFKKKLVRTRASIDNLFILPDCSFLIKISDWGQDWKQKKGLPFKSKIEGIEVKFDYFNNKGQFYASYSWDYNNYGSLYYIDKNGYAYTREDFKVIPKLTKYEISFN